MHARRWLRMALPIALLGWLAACAGGSGSSGFDIAESTAITRALTEQICVDHRGLMICPADSAAAGPERIDIGLDTATPLTCFQQLPTGPCGFTVPFAPLGFPSGTTFRLAARAEQPTGLWQIGTALQRGNDEGPTAPALDAPGAIDLPNPGASLSLQVAILVFLEPSQAGPSAVEELADSGADFAFVTASLTAQPVPGSLP